MAEQTDLEGLLADAEAERATLDVVIAHLRRKLGQATSEPTGNGVAPRDVGRDAAIVAGRVRPDEFFRLSIADAITKFLTIMKQPQNPTAIVNGIKAGGILTNAKNFYANVNTELKRMKARDLIVNTPSGWGLSEWYPNKPKAGDAKPKRKAKKRAVKTARVKALKDGSMVGPTKGRPLTYREFMGEYMRAGKPKKEIGNAWTQYKTEHGVGG